MKMWKLLCYDIKYGCIKNLKLLLFPVIFEMAVLFMLWQKMNSYAQYGISTQKHMGDVLLYNFGGMEKYKMSLKTLKELVNEGVIHTIKLSNKIYYYYKFEI
jgi:hypothetical protein